MPVLADRAVTRRQFGMLEIDLFVPDDLVALDLVGDDLQHDPAEEPFDRSQQSAERLVAGALLGADADVDVDATFGDRGRGDGRLLIEHSNGYLGHWGSTEEIAPGGGDRLSGTWTSKDGTADNHPNGTTTWQRVVARPLLMVLSGNAESSSAISEVGQVALSYHPFDWGPENDTPGSRPSFVIRLMGEDMWGHHIAEFRDTAGLQVRELLPVWAGDLREPWAMRGVEFKVIVWPGATAGRKTLWFDGQPIEFDLVIEGR